MIYLLLYNFSKEKKMPIEAVDYVPERVFEEALD